MSVDPNLTSSHTTNGSAPDISPVPTRAEISRERTAAHQSPPQFGSSPNLSRSLILIVALVVVSIGLVLNQFWIILAGSIVTLLLSAQILYPTVKPIVIEILTEQDQGIVLGSIGAFVGAIGLLKLAGADRAAGELYNTLQWDAIGALGEVFGALGQILIAVLAVYIAWRQYIISIELTVQQNTITQQQTIDTYFQGISDLVLDEEGLLEDWPQERAIAEGRTAAILSSVDGAGKAKIIRFLSRAKLLSPLKRDSRLGRAILNGTGGYAEDRLHGIRVIDLGIMLAAADLSGTDLRWTDLSEANLIRANLTNCDLVKTNFSRTVLCGASLRGADLSGTRFFYGKAETATPRSRTEPPNFKTGAYTGAVVENADFTGAEDMTEDQRYYCCAWGGAKTRGTIPGGCEGIPNRLGR
ncbi:pentapeptide repeat protein [Leptolyngbya sp. NIES-3755]|nr:pentapeptide repeat protein [Leptolyngbya sp. NIES-3755]